MVTYVSNSRNGMMQDSFPSLRMQIESTRLLLRVWRPVLVYGAMAQILVGLILTPLFLWIIAEVLTLARSDVVLNYDLASLALSVQGVALGLIWVLINCMLLLILPGGLASLTAGAYTNRRESLRMLVWRVLKMLSHVPNLGGLKLALLLLAAIPLIGALTTALTALLLAPFGAGPVEHWIPNEGRELIWVIPAGITLFCAAYGLYARWFLSIHCMILEDISLAKAVKRSAEIVRGSFWLVIRTLAVNHSVGAIFSVALALSLGLVGGVLLSFWTVEHGAPFYYLVAFLNVVSIIMIGGIAIWIEARDMALGTLLYFRLQNGRVPHDLGTGQLTSRPIAGRRMALTITLLLLGIGLATLMTIPEIKAELQELDTAVEVTGHRGSSGGMPENTLSSLRLAIAEGADFAEMDYQETKDGVVVAFHDKNLRRLTGLNRNVWEMTLEQLKALDVGAWFSQRFEGERIPTLDEVLLESKGRIRLNIELKTHGRESGRLASTVVNSIRRTQFADDCVITSTDYEILKQVRRLDPSLRLGIIVTARVGRLHKLDVDFYSVQLAYATVSFIREAHNRGRDVHVWTVNEPRMMRLIMDRGVDNIITDFPLRVIRILDERSEIDEFLAAILRLFEK